MVYIAIKESPKYVNDNLLGFYIQLNDIFDTREIIRRVFSKLADKKSVAHLFSIERDYIFEDVDRNCEVFSLNSLYNYMESSLFINRLLLSVFPCDKRGGFVTDYYIFKNTKCSFVCRCWEKVKILFLFKNLEDLEEGFKMVKYFKFDDFRFVTEDILYEMKLEDFHV